MPQVYNEYAQGFREVIFIVPESSYGVPVHPSATHAIQFLTADLSVTHERVNRADKTATRSYIERITHRKAGTWSVNLYVLPSGTNTTPPDVTDALQRGFGTLRAVVNGTIAAGSTTTVINVGTGEGVNYAAGDGIGLLNTAGDLEISFVVSVATDALTVSPGFSVAPSAAATLYGTTTYQLTNTMSPLSITRLLDNIVTVYTGAVASDLAFEFPGDGEATLTVGGPCKEEWSSGTSLVQTGINDSVTALVVTAGDGYQFEKNTRILIAAEGANTDEVVLITAVNYSTDTLTITRAQAGTSASAHGVGAVIGPYEPAQTVAGSPVTGTRGQFVITGASGARNTHETTNHGLTIGNNAQLRNSAIGQESATGFFVTAKRDVTFSVTLWLTKPQMKYYNRSKKFVMQEILMQWGNEVGKTWACKLPRAEFNIPPLDGGGDEEVMLSFTGLGLSAVGGNTECYVAFG